MKITYFYRHPQCGFSIQCVFQTLTGEIMKYAETEEYSVPSQGSKPWDVVRNCIYVFKHRNKQGINHITGHIHDVILALFRQKTVLTIHDLVFLDNVKKPVKRFYKWLFWLYLPVKLANKIVCISSETKKNILQHIQTDKLLVIPNPIDPSFCHVEKMFNKEKPVILHIGTYWNKNLKRTIEALDGISCHLRIVGIISNEIVLLLKNNHIEYSNVYELTNEEMKNEYIHCDIVNFPSEYEGFGMPVIEGQKTGRVVLASYIQPIIDISGGAAEFVDPAQVASIRNGYLHIIQDDIHRNNLIREGLKNVERFSAQIIAKQYLELYQQLMNE